MKPSVLERIVLPFPALARTNSDNCNAVVCVWESSGISKIYYEISLKLILFQKLELNNVEF